MSIVASRFFHTITCTCSAKAVQNDGGTLTIAGSRFSENSGIGVVWNGGTTRIHTSAFDDNASLPIANIGSALEMNDSRVSRNFTGHALPGAIFNDSATLYLTNTTIDHNIGDVSGGIVNTDGGQVTLTNSTIASNLARFDAVSGARQILPSGALTNHDGTAMVRSTTIAGNALVGFHDWRYHAAGIVTMPRAYTALSNSILSDNYAAAPVHAQDCFGAIHSLGYNLVSDSTECFVGARTTGNVIGVSAHLRPLAANGGPTMTAYPPWDSPVVDAGNAAPVGDGNATRCPRHDQRGLARPRDGNADGISRCDMGAVER